VIGFVIKLYAVDRVGRIQLQIIGFIGMAIGMLVVALSGDQSTTSFVIAGFIIFNLTVNLGPNATTYLLLPRCTPPGCAALGMASRRHAEKAEPRSGLSSSPLPQVTSGPAEP